VHDHNLLQSRTESSSKRFLREVIDRLKHLTPDQLELLVDATSSEQRHLLWLALCKTYGLLYDFSVEVVRRKFERLELEISQRDFDDFYEGKAMWYSKLEEITDSTRQKVRQVVFRMLREANLVSEYHIIQPVSLTPAVARVISQDSDSWFAIFPITIADIKAALT
jgi:hypothetical protein